MTARRDDGTGERPVVIVDVSGYHCPDLVLVDVLSRVRLVAGRVGAVVEVRGAGQDLARLLVLVGLLAVLPVDGVAPASEVGGEPEALEEPGVEEVVDVRHAPAADLEHLDRPRLVLPPGPARPVLGEGR
jgi:hypothetical protein